VTSQDPAWPAQSFPLPRSASQLHLTPEPRGKKPPDLPGAVDRRDVSEQVVSARYVAHQFLQDLVARGRLDQGDVGARQPRASTGLVTREHVNAPHAA
jgi:hypothetical protein